MIQVINDEIKQYRLPKAGTLKDGRTVSGYNLLGEDILRAEGWLPLEDNPPEYDIETQYLVQDGYEILEDKVIKKYRIEDIPEREEPRDLESEIENLFLREQVKAVSEVADFHEELIVELATMLY